jgi:CBS domain-containing protein
MQVSQIMTRHVECTRPDASLQEAAIKMRQLEIGPLPVCENDHIAGIVTDRDITVRATAEGLDPKTTLVREVMTPSIVYCFDDQDVEEAAKLMRDLQVRRLAVLDRNKRLVGIVSLGDLAVETGDDRLVGETLEVVSEPNRPNR